MTTRGRRGQAWYVDFMIGLIIFMSVLVSYYAFQESFIDPNGFTNDMISDAKQIASSLISEGYPSDWNSTNVERIGITDGSTRIDPDKLLAFSQLDYNTSRGIFRTSYEYQVVLKEGGAFITMPNNRTYIGSNSTNASALFKVIRMPLYNNVLTQLEVYVWKP